MTVIRKRSLKGAALIEFALSAALLCFLGIGAVSYSMAVQTAIVVSDAANAGARYGANSEYNATNLAGIQQVALNAGAGVPNLTVTASNWCTCSGGALVSCSTDCSTISAGGDLKFFVEVTASTTYNNFFSYAGLSKTFTIQSTAMMPVE